MVKRIVIAGNAGSGKTTLSRRLATIHQLPLTHVDSIQFLSGMKIRPQADSIHLLSEIEKTEKWIIEGYGPFNLIENRFRLADLIIFIDLPLWRLYWWSAKRQISRGWSRRPELPEGCDEFNLLQTQKLFKTIRKMHDQMRPQLLRMFSHPNLKDKMIYIRTYSDYRQIFKQGLLGFGD